jgi:hypothetical protein
MPLWLDEAGRKGGGVNGISLAVLFAFVLAGCSTPPTGPIDNASPIEQDIAPIAIDGTVVGRRDRTIDPDAQKALIERMKNCCGPVKQ